MGEKSYFDRLIEELSKLPGVGPKSAQRIAYYLLKQPDSFVENLGEILIHLKKKVKYCSICFNLSEKDPCEICSNPERDHSVVCVVAESKDVWAMERTNEYKGVYHVLGGLISPLDGVFPEDLRILELKRRVERGDINEVILATNSTTEGEVTAVYIAKLLRDYPIKITRIAYGIPVGTELDFADELTLIHALKGRQEFKLSKD
ncbi:MAG: recombination protein RecR [Dictyoglomus sp. NZ13-RE01]|nr:MAG: recombination protein RecR [Dictyoglomus sp. NZ13-RE01]